MITCKIKYKGYVREHKSIERNLAYTKVTYTELKQIDSMVTNIRGIRAKNIKQALNLRPSVRRVQKYLNISGCRKIRSKFCQMVSTKNRKERYIYASLCLKISFFIYEQRWKLKEIQEESGTLLFMVKRGRD